MILYKMKKFLLLYSDVIILKSIFLKFVHLCFFKYEENAITVVITSSGRLKYLEDTIISLKCNLSTNLPIYWCIIDDYPESKATLKYIDSLNFDIKLINRRNRGLGYSLNRIYNSVKTKYIFHCEDDWRFLKTIPVDRMIDILKQDINIGQVILKRRQPYKDKFGVAKNDYVIYEKTFSFNPHLTTKKIILKCLPYPLKETERKITDRMRKMNIKSAILGRKEEYYVTHIGEEKYAVKY